MFLVERCQLPRITHTTDIHNVHIGVEENEKMEIIIFSRSVIYRVPYTVISPLYSCFSCMCSFRYKQT